jgi:hypothetical protein
MSVESKGSNIRVREDGDKKGTALTSRMDAAPSELKNIGKVLAQRRIMRDTTNHPDVELSRTGRQGAIKRRLSKGSTDKTRSSPHISDSGSPDDAGVDSADNGAGSGAQN